MRNHLIFLIITLLTVEVGLAQGLIPRQALFAEEVLGFITLASNGKQIYYQQLPEERDRLYAMNIKSKATEVITLPGQLRQLLHFDADRLILLLTVNEKEELFSLDAGNQLSNISIPFQTERLDLRQTVASGGVVVLVQRANRDSTGFYWLEKSNKLSWILPFEGARDVFFDENANPIAKQQTESNGGYSLHYLKSDNWHPFRNFGWNESQFIGGLQKIISVSNNGQFIFFTDNQNSDKNQIVRLDLRDTSFKTLAVPDYADILPFGALLNIRHEPAIAVALFAKSEHHLIDATYWSDLQVLQKNIPGDISFAGQSWDGETLLIRAFTGHTQRYYVYNRRDQSLEYLLNDMPHLNDYEFAARTAFTMETSDGFHLPMHVYLPNGSDHNEDGIPDEPLPTVMYVHGGPWVGILHWNQWLHTRNFQLLANRGYAVIVTEFRGTTGLGKKVTEAAYNTWGSDMTRDKAEIAQWAIAKGIADKDKIGILGWSYGGYAAMAGLAFHPDLYACGIGMYGIADLESFCETPFAQNFVWQEHVGNIQTEDGRNLLRKHSPINAVAQIKSPLLLTTGSKDQRVPQAQSESMAQAMKKAKKEFSYFYYPEEGHDYRAPESWISFWAVAEDFLAKHLGGKKEVPGDDLEKGNFVVVEAGNSILQNIQKKE